jgi:hypothetical protein
VTQLGNIEAVHGPRVHEGVSDIFCDGHAAIHRDDLTDDAMADESNPQRTAKRAKSMLIKRPSIVHGLRAMKKKIRPMGVEGDHSMDRDFEGLETIAWRMRIILPDHPFRVRWDCTPPNRCIPCAVTRSPCFGSRVEGILIVAVMYSMVAVPMEVCFQFDKPVGVVVIDTFIDVFFIFDLCVPHALDERVLHRRNTLNGCLHESRPAWQFSQLSDGLLQQRRHVRDRPEEDPQQVLLVLVPHRSGSLLPLRLGPKAERRRLIAHVVRDKTPLTAITD